MRRVAAIATILVMSCCSPRSGNAIAAATPIGTIDIGGVARDYLVHLPPAYDRATPVSLVLVFHGGGGAAAGMQWISGMDAVADRHGFIAVYPQGIDRHWKDGRTPALSGDDDVAFIKALIAQLESQYLIDPKRVYATGISNGAFFSFRLACDLGGEIAAIAPVAGSIPVGFHDSCANQPVSVMMINGTDDRLVMFEGGRVGGPFVAQGDSIPVQQTLAAWTKIDGCPSTPRVTPMPDSDPADGTTTRVESFDRCRDGTSVQLYTVDGGGHTWPGGPQYLPVAIVGRVSRDFDASETMWQFFESHPHR